jgi:hypothetical protein
VSLLSPYGLTSCKWELNDAQDELKVIAVIPPNTLGRIQLPGVDEEKGSGVWTYQVKWKKDETWPPSPWTAQCTLPKGETILL